MKTVYSSLGFALSASAAVLTPRDQCCFSLTASGGVSGSVGQLSDGQNRIGQTAGLANQNGKYCISNGQITDGNGRGCILTPPTTQFQCDTGATPTGGFSVSNGNVQYNGSDKFYACPTGDNGGYNIYTVPVANQQGCVSVTLSTGGQCSGGSSSASAPSAPASSAPASSAPASSAPASSAPAPSAPASSAPAPSAPASSAPSPSAPASSAPAPSAPASSPAASAPTAPAPTTTTVYVTVTGPCVATSAPAPSAPASSAPASSAPASSAPASSAPASSGPASSKPASSAPASSAPATSAPASSKPASSASASKTSAQPSAPASSASGSACQTSLSGAYQTPHAIIPISSKNGDKSYGTQYNAYFGGGNSTIFNFDIPSSYSNKQCSLIFLFPQQKDLETSSFTTSGSGSLTFSQLSSAASLNVSYNSAPADKTQLGKVDNVAAGNSYVVNTGACQAGTTQSIKVSPSGDLQLEFFEDWNPSPIGVFITAC